MSQVGSSQRTFGTNDPRCWCFRVFFIATEVWSYCAASLFTYHSCAAVSNRGYTTQPLPEKHLQCKKCICPLCSKGRLCCMLAIFTLKHKWMQMQCFMDHASSFCPFLVCSVGCVFALQMSLTQYLWCCSIKCSGCFESLLSTSAVVCYAKRSHTAIPKPWRTGERWRVD